MCPLSKKCELILTQIFDALRSNKGGVKGEGIVAERRVPAQLRFAEPREHCMVGLLAHPTAVGFANPIDEDKRGIMPVACERLTKSLRVTAGTFTKSAIVSYYGAYCGLAVLRLRLRIPQ